MRVKCLDTYALIELALGNPAFNHYIQQDFVIAELTLAEFYNWLLKVHNEQTAEYWFKKFQAYGIPARIELILEAVRFRHEQRKQKKNFSFFDAVGYITAIKHQCVFVTGDYAFKELPHVEFRKRMEEK